MFGFSEPSGWLVSCWDFLCFPVKVSVSMNHIKLVYQKLTSFLYKHPWCLIITNSCLNCISFELVEEESALLLMFSLHNLPSIKLLTDSFWNCRLSPYSLGTSYICVVACHSRHSALREELLHFANIQHGYYMVTK